MAFARGTYAKAECMRCGFVVLLREIRMEYRYGKPTGSRVCPDCWDPQHPQDETISPIDNQSLERPMPEMGRDESRVLSSMTFVGTTNINIGHPAVYIHGEVGTIQVYIAGVLA